VNELEALKKRVAAKEKKGPVEFMKTRRSRKTTLTVSELKAAVEANPGHQTAESFGGAIKLGTDEELSPEKELTVETVHLEALLNDTTFHTERVTDPKTGEVFQESIPDGPMIATAPVPKKTPPLDKPKDKD